MKTFITGKQVVTTARKTAAFVLFILTALLLLTLTASADEFPTGGTFNGMQITYSISGVSIESSTDYESFTTSRTLTGKVTGKTVTLTATVKQENGYSADISASCGDQSYSKSIPVGESATFTLSYPVTGESQSVVVSISMIGIYNAGDRGLVVSGTFTNPNYYDGEVEIYSRELLDAGCIFSDYGGQVELMRVN